MQISINTGRRSSANNEPKTAAPITGTKTTGRHFCWGSSVLLAASTVLAQAAMQAPAGFTVVERGPHAQTWVASVAESDLTGTVHWRPNRYTELRTGLASLVQDPGSPATAALRITPAGVA